MFKALLIASLAMLACCAAAALAGPVQPATKLEPAGITPDVPPGSHCPLDAIQPVIDNSSTTFFESLVVTDGFVPSVSLTATHGGTAAMTRENVASLEPAVQPAVIPLPVPLYAGVALLALTLIPRRAILRAC